MNLTGPTSGPENITARPASAGAGRSRARTHSNNDNVGDDVNDDDDDDDDVAAAAKDTSGITWTVYWRVRASLYYIDLTSFMSCHSHRPLSSHFYLVLPPVFLQLELKPVI